MRPWPGFEPWCAYALERFPLRVTQAAENLHQLPRGLRAVFWPFHPAKCTQAHRDARWRGGPHAGEVVEVVVAAEVLEGQGVHEAVPVHHDSLEEAAAGELLGALLGRLAARQLVECERLGAAVAPFGAHKRRLHRALPVAIVRHVCAEDENKRHDVCKGLQRVRVLENLFNVLVRNLSRARAMVVGMLSEVWRQTGD